MIDFEKFQTEFTSFKRIYDSLIQTLEENGRIQLSGIKEYYANYKKVSDVEKAIYTIANFGMPNQRKSSSFNFLMTGREDFPLPASASTSVIGETSRPIRCRYTDLNKLIVKKNDDDNVLREFLTIDKEELHQYLKEIISTQSDIKELTIELPKNEFQKQYEQFSNFEFLDLIGWTSKMSNESMQLNRLAVGKRQIDAIFLFHNGRLEFPQDTLKSLWLTGIFSNLNERRAPKLINTKKIRKGDWKSNKELSDALSGFENSKPTKLAMQKTICDTFNFTDIDSVVGLDEHQDLKCYIDEMRDTKSLKQNNQFLEIENKAKSASEIIKRADCICLMDLEDTGMTDEHEETYYQLYLERLNSIKHDIKRYKNDQMCRESLEYLSAISEAILKKIDTYNKSFKLKIEKGQIFQRVEEMIKRKKEKYENESAIELRQICENFKETILRILNNENDIEYQSYEVEIENDDSDSQRENSLIINRNIQMNRAIESIIDDVANLKFKWQQIVSAIICNIKGIKEETLNKEDDLSETKMCLKSKVEPLLKNDYNSINYEYLLETKFSQLKNNWKEIFETILGSFHTNILTKKNIFNDKTEKQELESLKSKIKLTIKTENQQAEGIPANSYPDPKLFESSNSNKLPDTNGPIDIDQISKFIKFPFKTSSFKRNKSQHVIPSHFEEILNEGKVKSLLKIQHENSEETEFIQFHIDRDLKKITAEYNKIFFQKKLEHLHQNIKLASFKSLSYTFVSS